MEKFDSKKDGWASAFSLCRESQKPIIVEVDGERWKIYPSGSAKQLTASGTGKENS